MRESDERCQQRLDLRAWQLVQPGRCEHEDRVGDRRDRGLDRDLAALDPPQERPCGDGPRRMIVRQRADEQIGVDDRVRHRYH